MCETINPQYLSLIQNMFSSCRMESTPYIHLKSSFRCKFFFLQLTTPPLINGGHMANLKVIKQWKSLILGFMDTLKANLCGEQCSSTISFLDSWKPDLKRMNSRDKPQTFITLVVLSLVKNTIVSVKSLMSMESVYFHGQLSILTLHH